MKKFFYLILNFFIFTLPVKSMQNQRASALYEKIDHKTNLLMYDYFERSVISKSKFCCDELYGKFFYKCYILNSKFKNIMLHSSMFKNCTFINCSFDRGVFPIKEATDLVFIDCSFNGTIIYSNNGISFINCCFQD